MKRRGQVTIFIIVAVILVVAILFFLFIRNKSSSESSVPLTMAPISNFVTDCVSSTSEDAIWFIGAQGGYNEVPAPKEAYSRIEIPIYLYNDRASMPSVNLVEDEMVTILETIWIAA